MIANPKLQLFLNPYEVYFQDWLDDQAERWVKLIFWAKSGSRNPKLTKIYILQSAGCRKLVHPSKWLQEFIYFGCSQIYKPLREAIEAKDGNSRRNSLKLVDFCTLIKISSIAGDWCWRYNDFICISKFYT